jgi:hypothetical protein
MRILIDESIVQSVNIPLETLPAPPTATGG